MVPGYGADSDYEGIDVTGKIAVVQRGGTDENGEPITFVTKIQNACGRTPSVFWCTTMTPNIPMTAPSAWPPTTTSCPPPFISL